MEDILDVYELPYNPKLPVVCMDEKHYQCLGEIRKPLLLRLGYNAKIDSECAGGLYKKYPPEEARSYAKRLEIHYTPNHGIWLNIAEIELNVMTRQYLARRIDSISKVQQELKAWEKERNQECAKVIWHFTTQEARNKLISLYPKFEPSEE